MTERQFNSDGAVWAQVFEGLDDLTDQDIGEAIEEGNQAVREFRKETEQMVVSDEQFTTKYGLDRRRFMPR